MPLNDFFQALENADFLVLGVASAAILVLGFTVFISNTKSITSKTFLIFSVVAVFYKTVNFLAYQTSSPEIILWMLRLTLFSATWYALLLFQLFLVFPKERKILPKSYKFILLPIVFLTSVFTLTPFVFSEITEIAPAGQVTNPERGFGIIIFTLVAFYLVIHSLLIFFKKTFTASNEERNHFKFVLVGSLITYSLIVVFNLIIPVAFNNTTLIPLAPLFTLPFVLAVSYAVLKHKLFNIKVAGTGLLVFALSVVSFGEVIFAEDLFLIIYRSSIFVLILVFGILLIKGVLREVSLREQLQEANKAQENLIHFITHQVKGFFTKSRNIFAGIMEGDYGKYSKEMKPVVEEGFKSSTEAVGVVENILKASNIKKGTMGYQKKEFDLKELVEKVAEKERAVAEEKGLNFVLEVGDDDFTALGDKEKLEHAIRNLVDNAVKYTLKGEVKVSLVKSDGKIRFSVKDSGVGITPEDKKHLFTEGGHGKDSKKVNVDSTGYGLFIVKGIMEAHGGKVWAESEGRDRGSEFIVELPVAKSEK